MYSKSNALMAVIAAFVFFAARQAPAENLAPGTLADAKSLSKAFQQVAEAVAPSVVSLEVQLKPGIGWTWWQGGAAINDPYLDRERFDWLRRPVPPNEAARHTHAASGFVIDNKGTIVTAYHVVEHAEEIHVRTHDGHEFLATQIHTDPQSDIAILRIPAADDLQPVRFGNSDKLELGEWVIAVGNPFNTGVVLTAGIISTKGKGPAVLEHSDFLETTAVINLGNSGGPLLNLDGEVIGVNTLFQHPSRVYEGIHFAVPSNTAKWAAQQLLDQGKVRRAYLGVNVQELDFRLSRQQRVAPWSGVLVSAVHANSPADEGGIHEGDIIVEFDDHRVMTARHLQRQVERAEPGKTVEVAVLRHGQRQKIAVKLREQTPIVPANQKIAPPANSKSESGSK